MRFEMRSCGDNWITSWGFELAEPISEFHEPLSQLLDHSVGVESVGC